MGAGARDVVPGSPGAPLRPERDKEKAKKPSEDRVRQQALDYLRGEIKKVGAAGPVVALAHG